MRNILRLVEWKELGLDYDGAVYTPSDDIGEEDFVVDDDYATETEDVV